MSKNFLVPIDMNGLEIQNFLAHNLAAAPTGVAGRIYFNTADKKLYYHNGTEWVDLTSVSFSSVTGKPTANQTPSFGGTFTLSQISQNTSGQITATDRTVTIPNTAATTSTAGLMSASDKTKLDGIASGAEVNRTYSAVTGKPTADQAPAFGGTATVSQVSQDTTGQVSVTDRTITIPNTAATTSTAGLMSAADKTKLDGLEDGTVDIVAGNNVSITYDSTNDEVIIAATDTTYTIDQTVTSSSSNPVSSSAVYAFVEDEISDAVAATDAMRFMGTLGTGGDEESLPTSDVSVGDTYRVITAGTYAGNVCEVGDLVIAITDTPTWTVAQTNIDGAITSISSGTGVSVSGSGSSRTVALASGVATAGSVGDTSAQTPAFGGTFKAISQTIDTYGRTTATAEHTVTIPSTAATTSAAGLMSASDKTKLEGIATGAEVNRTYTAVTGKPTAAVSPAFGGTVTLSQISQSTTGQITATDRVLTIPGTVATTSTKGLVIVGSGLNVSSGTISTAIQNGTVTLSAGSTSTTASITSMIAFSAYDASTGEEVVIDATQGASAVTFSIASSYTNAITIKYMYAA